MRAAYNPTKLLQVALILLVFAVLRPAHALQYFDACLFAGTEGSAGTVDKVREVPLLRDLHAFDIDALEHSVRPELAEEIMVRLDIGPIVIFTQQKRHSLQAGQRVRVYLNGSIARLEREQPHCAMPVARLHSREES